MQMLRPMLAVQFFDIAPDGGTMLDVAPYGWRKAWVLRQWLGQGLGIVPNGGTMLILRSIAGVRLGCCATGGATLISRLMVAQCLGLMPNGWHKA